MGGIRGEAREREGGRGGEERARLLVYVINIHELQPSHSILFLSSLYFFRWSPRTVSYFVRFGAVFREGEILSRRRARSHVQSPQ